MKNMRNIGLYVKMDDGWGDGVLLTSLRGIFELPGY